MQTRQEQSEALQTQGMFSNKTNVPATTQPVQNDTVQQAQPQSLTYDGKDQLAKDKPTPVSFSRFR